MQKVIFNAKERAITHLIYLTTFLLLFKNVIQVLMNSNVQFVALISLILFAFLSKLAGYSKDTKICIIWYAAFFFVTFWDFLFVDRTKNLYTIVNTFLYIIIYSVFCQKPQHFISVVKSFTVLGCVFLGYILFLNFSILGEGRLGNYMFGTSINDSIQFSYYILIIICCAISVLIICEKKNPFYYIAIITLLIGITASVFNGTKKSVIVPLVFVLIYILIRYRKSAVKTWFYTITFMLLMLIIWNYIKDIEIIQTNFIYRIEGMTNVLAGGYEEEDISTSERLSYIPIAFNAFLDSPIWGMMGFGNAIPFFLKTIKVSHPHNDFLNMLAAGGVVYFILFYWFPFWTVKQLWTTKVLNIICIVLLTFCLSLLFNNFNSTTYNIPIINIFYVIAYKCVMYYKRNPSWQINNQNSVV